MRVDALAEVCHRYRDVVSVLVTTLTEIAPQLDDEARERVRVASLDVEAQLAAIEVVVDRALEDLGITDA